MTFDAAWAHSLLNPDAELPADLRVWNHSDPAIRFAVYRNNVVASLIQALADSFPVINALVGDEFFNAMTAIYVRQHPPRSPVLAYYGADFADFLQDFPPAASVPYLADIGRLEYAVIQAFHAADMPSLTTQQVQGLLINTEKLAQLQLSLHPSLQTLQSSFAIGSLWFAHQGAGNIADVQPEIPEALWILRFQLAVEVLPMSAGDCQFLQALLKGQPLGAAAESVIEAEFDLIRCLNVLLQKELITHFHYL